MIFAFKVEALPIPCENSYNDIIFVSEEKNCPPGYMFIRDETWEKKDYSSSDEMSPFVYNFLMEKMHLTGMMAGIGGSLSDYLIGMQNNDAMETWTNPKGSKFSENKYLDTYGFRHKDYKFAQMILASGDFNKVLAMATAIQVHTGEANIFNLWIESSETYGLKYSIDLEELETLKSKAKYLKPAKEIGSGFLSDSQFAINSDLFFRDISFDSLVHYLGDINLKGEKIGAYLTEFTAYDAGVKIQFASITLILSEEQIVNNFFSNKKRYAFVFGASDYKDKPMPQAYNDVKSMTKLLNNKGFIVIESINETIEEMRNTFQEGLRDIYASTEKNQETEITFYFSGHGLSVDGENFLIPASIPEVSSLAELKANALSLNDTVSKLTQIGDGAKLFIIDACRNNQINRRLENSDLFYERSQTEILAMKSFENIVNIPNIGLSFVPMKAKKNTILIYATAPGEYAFYIDNLNNSFFTNSLITSIEQNPEKSLTDILMLTRQEVLDITEGRQTTWDSSSLTNEYFFPFKPKGY